jgi:hypothetical protein
MWMHPGRIRRHSEGNDKSLLKVRGKVTKSHEGPGGSWKQRKHFPFFQMLLKPMLTSGKERTL